MVNTDGHARSVFSRNLASTNSAAPVPNDVLYEIFLQAASRPFRIERQAIQWQDSWLAATQVCRSWRKLALDAPRLWSTICVDLKGNINMVRLFVERSKNVTLQVFFLGWCPRDRCVPSADSEGRFVPKLAAAAQVLSGETHRIVEFSTGTLWAVELSAVLSPFVSEAPQLRVLRIGLQLPVPTSAVHDIPFGGQTPLSLEQLWLQSTVTSVPAYAGLTLLILHDQAAPTLTDFLSCLGRCPALRKISLATRECFVRDLAGRSHYQPALVSLSELEYLCLHLPHKCVEELLQYLRFPTTMRVRLYLCGDCPDPASLTEICPPLHDNIAHMTTATLDIYPGSVAIKSIDGHVRVEWRNEGGLHMSGFNALKFPALNHLTVGLARHELSSHVWKQIFALIPGLSTLQIDDDEGLREGLLEAIGSTPITGQGDASPPPVVICPNLTAFLVPRVGSFRMLPLVERCFRRRAARGAFLEVFEVAMYLRPDRSIHEIAVKRLIQDVERLNQTVRGLRPTASRGIDTTLDLDALVKPGNARSFQMVSV
ncbi:hypothetical protein B0H21DRAFT_880815 [Amylocystis lapponica]|nr:hypothetical protein B0H21DRAFT_880815 [Amylocystis lapponica]